MTTKKFHHTEHGDKCDSMYERDVINSLIRRGIRYEFKPAQLPYEFPIRGGFCRACDSDEVLQNRVYGADIRLRDSGLLVEIKGKWRGQGYPHKRNLMTYVMRKYPQWIAFIFMNDSRISYGSTTTNTQWAMKYRAFDASVGIEIPEWWADDMLDSGTRT